MVIKINEQCQQLPEPLHHNWKQKEMKTATESLLRLQNDMGEQQWVNNDHNFTEKSFNQVNVKWLCEAIKIVESWEQKVVN